MARKKLAIYTATGCRACENAILDAHYQISTLSRWADVVFWPFMLGSSLDDLQQHGEIDVCLFTGAISTAADEQAAVTLRRNSKVMVACGACAAFGGMPGLADLASGDSGEQDPSVADDQLPPLPPVLQNVSSLHQAVMVDYVVPGCPAPQNYLWATIQALVCGAESQARLAFAASRLPRPVAEAVTSGIMPPHGTVFAGERAVCASCSRMKQEKLYKQHKRAHLVDPDPFRCLLEQGLVCQGIATREGCGGLCTGVGVPCRGCFGKAENIYDPGAKMVSAISSTFDTAEAAKAEEIAAPFADLAGTFYRYTFASQCALHARPAAKQQAEADQEESAAAQGSEPAA